MVRTVRVRLELDRTDYRQGLRDAAGDTRGFDAEVRSAGKDVGAMGVEVKAAGRETESMGREVDTAAKTTRTLGDEAGKTKTRIVDLAKEIETTKAALKDLGGEFQRTGQVNISELNRLNSTLRDLERAKATIGKLLPGDDNSSGGFRSAASAIAAFIADLGRLGPATLNAGGSLFDAAKNIIGKIGSGVADASKSLFSSIGSGLKNGVTAIGSAIRDGVRSGLQSAANWAKENPWLAAAIAAGITVGTPVIGAAITGAIGAGWIAGGIALAARDPAVASAWGDVAQDAKAQLSDAADVFVEPLVRGAGIFGDTLGRIMPSIRADMAAMAPYATELLGGVAGFVEHLMPGIDALTRQAGPVLHLLAKEAPALGDALAHAFAYIAQGAPGGVAALHDILKVMEFLIETTGVAIMGFEHLYLEIRAVGQALSGHWSDAKKSFKEAGDWSNKSGKDAKDAAGGLDQYASSADAAASATDGLSSALGATNQSLQTLLGTMMSADQAAGQWRQGLLGLADGVKQHGTSLKENTTDGEANIQMLQDMVTKAAAVRDANVAQGQSVAYADDQYSKNIQTLIDNAVHLGFNRDQVQALIEKYKQVPGDVDTSVVLNGVVDAISKGQTLATILNNLDGKVSRAAVITTYRTIYQEQHYSAIEQGKTTPIYGVPNRWGGVYQHAAVGVLRDAAVYSAASPARYAYAEPSTGGEAFVPRRGDYGRSMSILNHAAAWYGARVVPAGAGGGVANVTVNVNAGMGVDGPALGRQIAAVLRPYIRSVGGGNVQVALGRG